MEQSSKIEKSLKGKKAPKKIIIKKGTSKPKKIKIKKISQEKKISIVEPVEPKEYIKEPDIVEDKTLKKKKKKNTIEMSEFSDQKVHMGAREDLENFEIPEEPPSLIPKPHISPDAYETDFNDHTVTCFVANRTFKNFRNSNVIKRKF